MPEMIAISPRVNYNVPGELQDFLEVRAEGDLEDDALSSPASSSTSMSFAQKKGGFNSCWGGSALRDALKGMSGDCEEEPPAEEKDDTDDRGVLEERDRIATLEEWGDNACRLLEEAGRDRTPTPSVPGIKADAASPADEARVANI